MNKLIKATFRDKAPHAERAKLLGFVWFSMRCWRGWIFRTNEMAEMTCFISTGFYRDIIMVCESTLVIMSLLKSLYGVYKAKNKYYIFFFLYSYVYYLIILPSKIHALITLWDMEWGTRGKKKTFLNSYWSVIVWYSALIGGFAYSIYKNHFRNIRNYLVCYFCERVI
jgi:hypothetical protein